MSRCRVPYITTQPAPCQGVEAESTRARQHRWSLREGGLQNPHPRRDARTRHGVSGRISGSHPTPILSFVTLTVANP